jgi:hypothetical protein
MFVAGMEEKRDAYMVLVGKPEGKITFGRPKCGWENSIKWIFKK